MLVFPEIDPVIFSIGPLQVRWYGLMYVLGFIAAWLLVRHQAKRFAWDPMLERLDDLLLALMLGLVLGARLGFVLVYNFSFYLHHPLEIFAIWNGGMSFHGGCVGAFLAGWWFCRRTGLAFWPAADLFVTAAPIGIFFGRIGNFINAELYGRITDVPWAMIFPNGGPLPRHPSQLYEAIFEGICVFLILWQVKEKPWQRPTPVHWPPGSIFAFFLILYGGFRFVIELFREPDSQLGFVLLHFSMGQLLCLLMIMTGILLWWIRCKQHNAALLMLHSDIKRSKRRRG